MAKKKFGITRKSQELNNRAAIFRANVRFLMYCNNFTIREASNAWGVNYDLLKRWHAKGLAYPNPRTEAALKQMAAFWGQHDPRCLWTDFTQFNHFNKLLRATFFGLPNHAQLREVFLDVVRKECDRLQVTIPKELDSDEI